MRGLREANLTHTAKPIGDERSEKKNGVYNDRQRERGIKRSVERRINIFQRVRLYVSVRPHTQMILPCVCEN